MQASNKPPFNSMDDMTGELVRINQDVSYQNMVASGIGIAVGVGVMALVGGLVFTYDSQISLSGYLLLILLVTPLLLSYAERIEGIDGRGGLYGLARSRHGLTLSFLVGWLEIAGYTTVIVLLARTAGIYGLSIYQAFGGVSEVNLSTLTLGVVALVIILEIAGIHGSRKLNTWLAYAGLVFLGALAIFSLIQDVGRLEHVSASLRPIAPFKLSALLLSSFWGVILIFGDRHRVLRRGRNSLSRAGWMIMLVVIGLGMLLSVAILPVADPEAIAKTLTVNELSAIVYTGEPIYTVLIGAFALLIAFMGVRRGLQASAEVMSQMTVDGYFPQTFNYQVHRAIFPPLLFVAILATGLVFITETLTMAGMAAAFLSAATILIHAPDIIQPEPSLPKKRSIHLPYHPLFPALTVVVATLAIVNLPSDTLKWSGGWLLLGSVLLGSYAYGRALKARARKRTFAEEAEAPSAKPVATDAVSKEGPTVLLLFQKRASLPALLPMGVRLAGQVQKPLIVMQIAEVPDDLSEEERRWRGIQQWKALVAEVASYHPSAQAEGVSAMVRVAHDPILGAVNAIEELQPEYVLIAPDFLVDDPAQNFEHYDAILRKTSSHVVFLNQYPATQSLQRIAVFMDSGLQGSITLNLAQAFLSPQGIIEVVHVLSPEVSEEEAQTAKRRIEAMLAKDGYDALSSKVRVVRASSFEEGVANVSREADLVILAATKNFMTRRATFDGVIAHVFLTASAPVVLASKYEPLRFAWFSRLWEAFTRPLPKLTLEEREEAARSIIAGADPTVDFFILILLSAGIATYGLLQNSGAVIIGAMLVAPLMSPIVAMAMSMVQGKVKNLGVAAQSTAQGVLLAIAVGAVLTFVSPIKSPTNEIMARVSPNLLDLSIAFLSGAAGAYAMSRKSIASALPGVSIAVALVPPLAVVGFGFASADLNIAFGALLLFFTNLIAIVFAASLVFIALDFLSTEKQTWGEIVRGLKVTLVFLALVIAILGWVTFKTVDEQKKLRAIDQVLNKTLYSTSFKPVTIDIQKNKYGYTIKVTVLSYDRPLSSAEVEQLGKDLEDAVGAPVNADIITIPAQEARVNFETATTSIQIEEAIRDQLKPLPIELLSIEVAPAREGFSATLSVLELQPNSMTAEVVNRMEASLSQQFPEPVKLQVYVIPAQKLESPGMSNAPPPIATGVP